MDRRARVAESLSPLLFQQYQEAKKDEQEKDTLGNRVANIKFITKNQNPFQKVPWAAWINSYTVLHIMVVWLYWLVVINRIPIYVFWGCQLLRLPIISALVSYFKFKELQPNVNVSTISAFKFVLLIFLFTHYVGLVFYFLCLVVGFDANLETQSWVVQFEVNNFLPVQLSPTLTANVYFMCIYKGLNSLTNLGFEGIVPRRMEELLCGIVTFMMQIVVEAYILGR